MMAKPDSKQTNTEEPQAYIILGMHRSGTSAFAGELEHAGLVLGDVIEYAPDNIKGSRESELIMTLHDDILRSNSCSWHEPISKLTFSALHVAVKKYIIANQSGVPAWGFKDPRSLLVLDFWHRDLPFAHLLGIFRHPFYVAESLHRRNGFSYEKGMELWLFYNRILLWHVNNKPNITLIEFCENAADYRQSVSDLISWMGLENSNKKEFFDNNLRQKYLPDLSEETGAQDALVLYEKLKGVVCR